MPLLHVVLILFCLAVAVGLVRAYLPVDPKILNVFYVVVGVAVLVCLLATVLGVNLHGLLR